MKRIVILSMVMAASLSITAQTKKAATVKANPHLTTFKQALTSGDFATGIIALNYYIAEQGNANAYVDTLAMLYMQQGEFAQCYYWADQRLLQMPEDNGLLEMKGICLDKLQKPKEAIAIFEKLFSKTLNPYHGYKLMELQYGIKRLAECVLTAEVAEKLPYKPEYLMNYTVGDRQGRTYLQAGVYNIHGLALYDLGKKEEAKIYFEKAVALDSTFALAKQNVEALRVMLANNSVNPVTPTTVSPANKQN